MYTSSSVTSASPRGAAVGSLSFSNVLFNNQTDPSLPAIGNGTSTDGSGIVGFTCGALYSQILNFPKNIWGGNRLLVNQTMLMVIATVQQTLQQQTLQQQTFQQQTCQQQTFQLQTLQQQIFRPKFHQQRLLPQQQQQQQQMEQQQRQLEQQQQVEQ